jgi:hypothetical protein
VGILILSFSLLIYPQEQLAENIAGNLHRRELIHPRFATNTVAQTIHHSPVP